MKYIFENSIQRPNLSWEFALRSQERYNKIRPLPNVQRHNLGVSLSKSTLEYIYHSVPRKKKNDPKIIIKKVGGTVGLGIHVNYT